jgi:hypothetical protein
MFETVGFFWRGFALRTAAFVCLFEAAQLCIGVLPCMVYPHTRTERHL